jgi:hypothetical protein
MKKLNYVFLSRLIVFLSILVCSYSFCAASGRVYNYASVTYLHANGETPSMDEEYSDGTPVVLPAESNLCQAKGKIIAVDNVFGLKTTSVSETVVVISWKQVDRYVDADSLDTTAMQEMRYIIYYSTECGSGYQILATLDSQTFSCTHTTGTNSPTYYYIIVAVDNMENTSGYTPAVDGSNNLFVYRTDAITAGDTCSRLFIPNSASTALYSGGAGNSYNDDIYIEATRVSNDEGVTKQVGNVWGLVATSVSFDAYRYRNRERLSSFVFPSNVRITLKYEIVNGVVKNTTLRSSQIQDKLGLYYFNGLQWVKLPAELNLNSQTLTTTVNHLSKYALISGSSNPTRLTLNSRIPPIFTPNGDHVNDYVFFTFEYPAGRTPVSGKIFDLSGSLVREITEYATGQMKWDGKDSAGNLMESGVYVNQIQAGSEFISGTVVLAK